MEVCHEQSEEKSAGMMDTLSVSTCAEDDGQYATQWKWRRGNANMPSSGGTITTRVSAKYSDDQVILAELGAIHHLLCVVQVQGTNRLGNGLAIEASCGAIRKAVAKGTLKKDAAGRTDKPHVALFSQFLATKFFEASISVVTPGRWALTQPRVVQNYEIVLDDPPMASIKSDAGDIVVSRHALNRFVEKFVAAEQIKAGQVLVEVPDLKWTRAWQILETIVPQSRQVDIQRSEWQRIVRKYGQDTLAMYHADSMNVFIVRREWFGLVMVTAMRDSDYNRIVPKLPTYAGGRLIHQVS